MSRRRPRNDETSPNEARNEQSDEQDGILEQSGSSEASASRSKKRKTTTGVAADTTVGEEREEDEEMDDDAQLATKPSNATERQASHGETRATTVAAEENSNQSPIVPRRARKAAALPIVASRAAYQSKSLGELLKKEQSYASTRLSPTTEAYVRGIYEQKLARCVAVTLFECVKTEKGWKMAREILEGWKKEPPLPLHSSRHLIVWSQLLHHCTRHLISLGIKGNVNRLTRLCELWGHDNPSRALLLNKMITRATIAAEKDAAAAAAAAAEDAAPASTLSEEMMQRLLKDLEDELELQNIIPLEYSVSDVTLRQIRAEIAVADRSILYVNGVDRVITMTDEFIQQRLMEGEDGIDVVTATDDEATRFYAHARRKFPSISIHLSIDGKSFGGERESSRILITTTRKFIDQRASAASTKGKRSFVSLDARDTLHHLAIESFPNDGIKEYLVEVYTWVVMARSHIDQLVEMFARCSTDDEEWRKLVRSWNESYNIITEDSVDRLRREMEKENEEGVSSTEYAEDFRRRALKLAEFDIDTRTDEIKPDELLVWPTTATRRIVDKYSSRFVRSAFAALDMILGDEYAVIAKIERRKLAHRVSIRGDIYGGFGLQQFLELKHGCEMTPFLLETKLNQACLLNAFEFPHMLLIALDSTGRRSLSDLKELQPVIKELQVKLDKRATGRTPPARYAYNGSEDLIDQIKKCPSQAVLVVLPSVAEVDAIYSLLVDQGDGMTVVCQTAEGWTMEARPPSSLRTICLTTTAFFECWWRVPRVRETRRVFVIQSYDKSGVDHALDVLPPGEIEWMVVPDSSKEKARWHELTRDRTRVLFEETKDPSLETMLTEAMEIVEMLPNTKRTVLHSMRWLERAAKVVEAFRQPIDFHRRASDGSSDIASDEFIESCREDIEWLYDNFLVRIDDRLVEKTTLLPDAFINDEIDSIEKEFGLATGSLTTIVQGVKKERRGIRWGKLKMIVEKEISMEFDSRIYFNKAKNPEFYLSLLALTDQGLARATEFLPLLERFHEDEERDFHQSDRPISRCTTFKDNLEKGGAEWKRLWVGMLKIPGTTIERFYGNGLDEELPEKEKNWARRSSHEDLFIRDIEDVMAKTVGQHQPLFLFPQRCFDKLTSALIDRGVVGCSDLREAEKKKHPYDRLRFSPLYDHSTNTRSMETTELWRESAVTPYGSRLWAAFLAKHILLSENIDEAVRFHKQILAHRDVRAEDEELIEKLRVLLSSPHLEPVCSEVARMKMEAYTCRIVEMRLKGEFLADTPPPPYRCPKTFAALASYVRAGRLPRSD